MEETWQEPMAMLCYDPPGPRPHKAHDVGDLALTYKCSVSIDGVTTGFQ